MKPIRNVIYDSLPRSQEWPVVDELISDLADAGYVIVPKNPTEAMMEAGWKHISVMAETPDGPDEVWLAMVETSAER